MIYFLGNMTLTNEVFYQIALVPGPVPPTDEGVENSSNGDGDTVDRDIVDKIIIRPPPVPCRISKSHALASRDASHSYLGAHSD